VNSRAFRSEFARFPRGGPESRTRAQEIAAKDMKAGAVSQRFTARARGTDAEGSTAAKAKPAFADFEFPTNRPIGDCRSAQIAP
jgi:hypothetical protein